MKHIKRKHKLIACLCVCVLVLVYFAVSFLRQEKRMRELNAENALLQQELSELQLQRSALEGDLENASTDEYIERVAREELGFVKEGEIKFVEAEGD